MNVSGKVIQLLPIVTGQGKKGQWSKQEFIIETKDQYPRKICISLWGEEAINKYDLEIGLELTAHINIESREYNGRWYTEIRTHKLEWDSQQKRKWQPGNQESAVSNAPESTSNDDTPF